MPGTAVDHAALRLRLTPGAKQTLQRAANAAQRSVSEFVLESALANAAETLANAAETLADRQSFQLDGEQWEAFVAAAGAERAGAGCC
ncbi:MAG: DUF1778 domain-containing protein [Cyanobium sp.]